MHLIDQQLNLMIRGRFDEARVVLREIEKEMLDNPRALFNRGWFLINEGKFQEGFQHLEHGRFLSVYGSPQLNTGKPIWHPQNTLKDKVVIINLEGGLGDEIMHARFAAEINNRGGKCILCADKTLGSLLSRVPGVEKVITKDDVQHVYHDYWIPGFSCSWIFGHDIDNFPNKPYIFPDKNKVNEWKDILNSGKKIKIGIRWSGNPEFEHQQFRIFPANNLIDLYKEYDHIQFYSLQRDNDIRELPPDIIDLQDKIKTWEDTAACIKNLDLMISSCTSIAHLSAAMGHPTWVIVPILPYHVWTYKAPESIHSPWYEKTTRVFRQHSFGEWDDTFDELRKELNEKFK